MSRSEQYARLHSQGAHHYQPEQTVIRIGRSVWPNYGSAGHRFNELVLGSLLPTIGSKTTVAAVIAEGKRHGFTDRDSRKHLLFATIEADKSEAYLQI